MKDVTGRGRWLVMLALWLAGCGFALPAPLSPALPPASLPNGVAAGDVSQSSAVLWARSTVTGPITFTYGLAADTGGERIVAVAADPWQPVTVTLSGLQPGATYRYAVQNGAGERAVGRFRTAAPPGERRGLRFGASGDWRGDLAPYPAMRNIPANELDFFLALGDTIYADIGSPAVPGKAAESLDEFRRKYAEVFRTVDGSNDWARLRAGTGLYAIFDDHEVTNDFAGGAPASADRRFVEESGFINDTRLYEEAILAFQEYSPLAAEYYGATGDERTAGERKFYRYRTFGSDAALFLLDSRSFRDLPLARARMGDAGDEARFTAQSFRPGRTLLGATQFAELRRDLLATQAAGVTWKFIAGSVPVQYRGLLSAQDRFEGYAAERSALLAFIAETPICNVVFVSADIHGTLVNDLSYAAGPGEAQIPVAAFEVTVGPVAFDPPQGPVLVEHGVNAGLISGEEEAVYAGLPVAADGDSEPNDKDDWVKAYIDRQLAALGYDAIGLDAAPLLSAELITGDYAALHTFGWTEFAVDAESQELTVTTWGIAPYGRGDLRPDPAAVLERQPQIVSRFRVQPSDERRCVSSD